MIKLTSQGKLVLMICVIQIVFFQLITLFMPIPTTDKLVVFFLVLIALGISTFYVTYSVKCMVVGKCNMWAWILAGIFITSVVFGMLSTTATITKAGKLIENAANSPQQQNDK